jgi:hypothetical protein
MPAAFDAARQATLASCHPPEPRDLAITHRADDSCDD